MPSVNPTIACTSSDARKGPVSVGIAGFVMWWAAASASAAATPAFTVLGIMFVLNGGATNSHADARTSARMNAVTRTGLIGIVI